MATRSSLRRACCAAAVLSALSTGRAAWGAEPPLFRTSPWLDGAASAALWGTTLALQLGEERLLDRPCGPENPCRSDGINALDRIALGHWSGSTTCASCDVLMTTALLAGPLLEVGRAADRSDWEGLGAYMLVYLQAVGLTSLTVKTLKLAVHRPMPFVYDFTPAEQGELALFDYQAFPSGHTAHAFAGAGVVTFAMARRYGSTPATWIAGGAAHAAALATGLVKIGVGIHYPTDVLVGVGLQL
jgi:hypothetical protein